MTKITLSQVKELIATNHVVFAYPRKNLVVVNGFKRYEASDAVCKFVKESAK